MTNRIADEPLNVLVLIKPTTDERYTFTFTDDQKSSVLKVFGRFASNTELSFTWYDAAKLSQEIRQIK